MGWLTDWQYRKKIDITGQTGAGTDYQVKLSVEENTGSYTSDLCSGGTPSANSDFGGGYEADKAFDDNSATYWLSTDGSGV